MSLQQDMRTYLLSKSGVTNLVTTTGVFCQKVDQGYSLPYVVIYRIGAEHGHTLVKASGWALARLQIDCFAATFSAAEAIAEAVRQVLHGLAGTFGTTQVSSVVLDNDGDDFGVPNVGDDVGTYRTHADYRILYAESIPTT